MFDRLPVKLRDIIFFSGIEWYGQNRMPCHHLVERLAKTHRVFYVNNFGALRDLDKRDFLRCVSKVSGLLRRHNNPHCRVEDQCERVHVWQPWVLPTPRLAFLQKINVALLRRSLKKLYEENDIQAPIIWTRLPTPIVWESIQGFERSALVYQSIDKFPEHPRIAESLRSCYAKSERLFNQHADLVFASAHGLYEEKVLYHPNTHFLPNGVSASFAEQPTHRIDLMETIKGPVVGFAGALGTATDIPLLCELAEALPEVTFVFLGTIDRTESVDALESLRNVHLQGLVAHAELISWFRYFDIGLLPYRLNHYQDYTFPSKLAEYLMAGLPIVATRLPELEAYVEVAEIADSVQEMVENIERILASNTRQGPEQIERRKHIASRLTWEAQIVKVEDELEALNARSH
jgi:glycosyltransferase involved in cell wall biosynthesis